MAIPDALMIQKTVARNIRVQGIVQGVGFRPFIYQLAHACGLNGEVANTAEGVYIRVEGPAGQVAAFEAAIAAKAPPLSRITGLRSEPVAPDRRVGFRIAGSRKESGRSTLISPDVAVCDACLKELRDETDRRYRYPFINCTHCGPRYTIIEDIPYDRVHTAMRVFPLCEDCRAEYEDPLNRRFHAQPNACPACGPRLFLLDGTGREIPVDDPVRAGAQWIREGAILAVKGLGGFHLAVDGLNDAAVTRLRARKRRNEKSFALMSPSIETVRRFAVVTDADAALLESPSRPIVLVEKLPACPIAPSVSPGNRFFGVMLPYTPLHHLLMDEGFEALVMTSANLAEEPICIGNEEALRRLSGIADGFLVHDREIYLRTDDSVVAHLAGKTRFIRRSRGYVPSPVFLEKNLPPVLGVGAELKNTICLIRKGQAFLSQHIGDLENLETLDFFKMTIRHLEKILDIAPRIVAHDLHPDYLSTRYALSLEGVETLGVQHHHAHVVSCMAEHHLEGPVIGLSFDGTGYGLDGRIWGGEVLVATAGAFTRAAHLEYVPMPGGAAAIRHPWRMAMACLHQTFGKETDAFLPEPLRKRDPEEIRLLAHMMERRINSPETSSLGRLFDAVAALSGLCETSAFEGQAAMMLEMAAPGILPRDGYEMPWTEERPRRLLLAPLVQGIVKDLSRGVAVQVISGRFHQTLIRTFSELCRALRREWHLNHVVLSGGVFQNRILLSGFLEALGRAGFSVYAHEKVPTNDGGIALGQAVAAAFKKTHATGDLSP